ncbi:MAG: TIGR03009 domain-containing protein [Rhodopirellula sp.]|nr:TIGR03009 domain-containing protein [Rhodopirellula sp.]OUX49199.1 MAG: hypothetical protein CBE43_10805 [Rhodopirellula sp. TMED283]
MKRLTLVTLVVLLGSLTGSAQQNAAEQQPFPPLTPQAKLQLQQVLLKWEKQSQTMKTLECRFMRWHYDNFAAPANVPASKAEGIIKYASPDKGLFCAEELVFFAGRNPQTQKPVYEPQNNQFGEYWVCNGTQLIEFDRSKQECTIQELPENMRGKNIVNGPLPFVFNLDAKQIQERYWVRQVASPDPNIIVVEAWPKLQELRAQYKLVQIALEKATYQPHALLMYAPNFHPKNAPKWDHYEFKDIKRNAVTAGFQQKFLGNFIPSAPPKSWKIRREQLAPRQAPQGQQQQLEQAQKPTNIRG